jgi:plastocyanin
MTAFRILRRADRHSPVSWSAAVLVAALLLAACGGSSSTKSTTSTPSTLPGAGSKAGPTVEIVPAGASWKFVPESLTVATDGVVTWINKSDVAHNVVFTDASVKSSDLFDKGKSFTTTFAKAGAYPYICSIHPDMKGTVVVQ